MNAKERIEFKELLRTQGWAFRDLGTWPAKATYYKQNGEAMPNLPAEPTAMKKYLRRGFLLYKPTEEQIATHIFGKHPELLGLFATPLPWPTVIKCPECGKELKTTLGVKTHMTAQHKRSKS